MTREEKRHLLYIIMLALAVRLFIAVATPVIGTDCYNFFHAARCFAGGEYLEALRHRFHPLFPFLISLAYSIVGNYEVAGKAVSLSFGVLTVFPLYFFTRSLFGHRAAIFAAAFLALNPSHVRLSADIMSDPAHIFFFTTAVWLTWMAIEKEALYLYALTGAVVSLDYLTRTEGIGMLPLILTWLIIINYEWDARTVLQKSLHAAVLTGAFILTATPYLVYIKQDTGHWHYTRHLAVKIIEGKHEADKPNLEKTRFRRGTREKRTPEAVSIARWKETGQYHRIFIHILNEFAKVFYQPLLIFLFVGLFKTTGPPFETISAPGPVRSFLYRLLSLRLRLESLDPRREIFIISVFCIYFVPLYLIAYKSYFISGRYVLPMAVLSLPWAGLGFDRLSAWLAESVPRTARPLFSLPRSMLILSALVLAVTLPKTLKIKRRYEVSRKEAGYWIKEQFSGRPVIMGDEKAAFYAQGEYVITPPGDFNVILHTAYENNIDYLMLYREKVLEDNPDVYDRIENSPEFVFVKEWLDRYRTKTRHLRLYRFVPKK